MSEFKSFKCAECGKSVRLQSGLGRTREIVRGFPVPIPDDFLIPTCSSCGEVYFDPEITDRLDPILRDETMKAQARHYRQLVDILTQRHGVAQKTIVSACGITPSHLSHILAGTCLASNTLTRLIEAYVACGSEFARHVDGRAWTHTGVLPFIVRSGPDVTAHAPQWVSGGASANDTHANANASFGAMECA